MFEVPRTDKRLKEALESESDGRRLPRIPARRAFWFGWVAQFPETELVR